MMTEAKEYYAKIKHTGSIGGLTGAAITKVCELLYYNLYNRCIDRVNPLYEKFNSEWESIHGVGDVSKNQEYERFICDRCNDAIKDINKDENIIRMEFRPDFGATCCGVLKKDERVIFYVRIYEK